MLAKRIEIERITISSTTHMPPNNSAKGIPHQPPQYSIKVQYLKSSNGGKSLLGKGEVDDVRGYNEFFDGEGTMSTLR